VGARSSRTPLGIPRRRAAWPSSPTHSAARWRPVRSRRIICSGRGGGSCGARPAAVHLRSRSRSAVRCIPASHSRSLPWRLRGPRGCFEVAVSAKKRRHRPGCRQPRSEFDQLPDRRGRRGGCERHLQRPDAGDVGVFGRRRLFGGDNRVAAKRLALHGVVFHEISSPPSCSVALIRLRDAARREASPSTGAPHWHRRERGRRTHQRGWSQTEGHANGGDAGERRIARSGIASRDAPIVHRNRTGGGSGRLSRDCVSVLLASVAGRKVAA
jgi:hypothetical protein